MSISGLWKADLFLGKTDSDKWVGTTVKINEAHLQHAPGLRIGIVPCRQGKSDSVRRDDDRNLVICPLPYDGAFMEVFYQAWAIVKQFMYADARLPDEVYLPRQPDWQVCRFLEERRGFPVLDVIEALRVLAQPSLLKPDTKLDVVKYEKGNFGGTGGIIAPIPRNV